MLKGKSASLGGVVAAALLVAAAPAFAGPFGKLMPPRENRDAPTLPVARYIAVQGQSFVFDRQSAPQPLLKFDDSPEVWVLEPSPAPRGDTVYRNDAGEPVLRITRLGGLTLFTDEEPEGVPVSMLGEAENLLPAPGSGPILSHITQLTLRASRAAQHPVTFEAPNFPTQAAPLLLDAAAIASDAVVRMAHRSDCRMFLSRLDRMVFVVGSKAGVSVTGTVMQIVIAPGKGYAGRPSSGRLLKAALKR